MEVALGGVLTLTPLECSKLNKIAQPSKIKAIKIKDDKYVL
jgi:hypothetical protein